MGRYCYVILSLIAFAWTNATQGKPVFTVDTMTYAINLAIPENAHLKELPEAILKDYFRGQYNAYYPKREMNEILPDDLLAHYGKTNFQCGSQFCWEDYADHPYLEELYRKFNKEIRYKEVLYYNAAHAVVKREVLWIQLVYTDYYPPTGNELSVPGPKFWMFELYTDPGLQVPNPYNPGMRRSLRQEFENRLFVPNEIGKENLPQKSKKYDNAEEH